MIGVDEALSLLDHHRPVWGQETLPLSAVNGCTLANDITAPFDYPKRAVSVMDGYAFRAQDTHRPLTLIGQSRAGEPFKGKLGADEAVRIFTGAIMPSGADSVEMQENAVVEAGSVSFSNLSTHRNFIRKAGADFTKGTRLFRAGDSITPAMILTLATCNFDKLTVKRTPSVALLSSGDELKAVGSTLEEHHIINSIGPALSALLTQWGVPVVNLGIAKDEPSDITQKLKGCEADIIVPIGAASVGDYDFMQSVAGHLSYEPIFSKVAVKPGKPTWFSKRGKQFILGLPGNPSSAWVCAQIFLKTLIFGGHSWHEGILSEGLGSNGPRESYKRGLTLSSGKIKALQKQDSGLVTPLSQANILIKVKPFQTLKAGESCSYIYF